MRQRGFLRLAGLGAADGAWPVERVVDLAWRASDRNAANVPHFIAVLEGREQPLVYPAAGNRSR
jgi:hypothetical protein